MSIESCTRHKAELPFSLIESEIFPRVAAKSDVGRCRCVCKQWKSFLSTPTFAWMHLHQHTTINDYKLLILDGQPPPELLHLIDDDSTSNLDPDPMDVFVLASLDGLVCLGLGSQGVATKLVFWNPLTGVHRKLSCIPSKLYFSSGDPIGFYKDSSNDYKLVHLAFGGGMGVYIYSHRLDSWRQIEFSFGSVRCLRWSVATLCGQCLYFTMRDFSNHLWIVCFDVEKETFRKIQFPSVPDGTSPVDYSGSLVVLNGCVQLCVSYVMLDINYKWSKQAELWRMDGDDGWVKMASLSDPLPRYTNFTMPHICTSSIGNWVAVMDQEKNSLEKVKMEDFTRCYPYFGFLSWEYRSSRMIYVETLVSPLNP